MHAFGDRGERFDQRPFGRLRAEQAARQSDQRRAVCGDGVHLPVVEHLQQVLGAAQQRVVPGQRPRLAVGQQAGIRQTLDGGGGVAAQHLRIVAGIGELQALDQKLDVAYPAAAVLDVDAAPQAGDPGRRRRQRDMSVAHPADRVRHLGMAKAAPHDRLQAVDQPLAELDVAGHRPAAQQRLHLPQAGAALVVVGKGV